MTRAGAERAAEDDVVEERMAAVILAGGLSRRMGGGDKCLTRLDERSLLEHVIARARPQTAALVLNANGDPERFEGVGLPVVADGVADFAGPLAGVLAGLDWAAAQGFTHVVSVAADTPFFPETLTARLRDAAARAGQPLACAASGGRDHPTFGLWPVRLREDLRRALTEEGLRKVVLWTDRHGCARADFSDVSAPGGLDPFFNVNTPEDLARARDVAAGRQATSTGDAA